ncbi:MAG: hypothetical protein AB7U36_08125 [Desulfobacter sp.]
MKKLSSIIILLSSFSFCLFSCSQAPKVVENPFSFQKRLEATHHWEILAKDFSKQLGLFLEGNTINKVGSGYIMEREVRALEQVNTAPTKPSIYIQTNDRSVFGKTFRQSLVNELIVLGYPIAYSQEGALTLRWSVQKIEYKADRTMNKVPGTYTALAAIGYGVYKLCSETSAFGATIVAGAVIDALDQGGEYLFERMAPKSEINLAITISHDGSLLARQSGVYYINSEDAEQYANIPDFEGREEMSLPGKIFFVVNQ